MFKGPSTSDHAVLELRELVLGEIVPNLSQPRQHFDEAALQELAGSLRERGVLQPVLVRPRPDGAYELIAGERRWRAAALAGLQRIPALVSPCDDAAALEVALIENMAREDLNPVEEAQACATLVQELGLTLEQVGRRVGRGRVAVSNLLRLLDLPREILELMERGELSEGHGRALLTAKDVQVRRRLAEEAVKEGWSVRVLEAHARESNEAGPSCKQAGKKKRKDEDDALTVSIAEAWGDLVGAEVGVSTLFKRVRVEFLFHCPEAALATATRLSEEARRGSKGK
ncbi:MAG TPA: ParB/RepB/Spo0J family partition protein [Solirubrobacteraceae bacterium]|jgi:ParB family chromosome partitioning protein|nr:ParB/RepB/Spo0J family partition protein [Solirubrobacteraceae bacterium]